MFENKTVKGIYYSRIIASWVNEGGTINRHGQFQEWLKELGLNDDEIREITNFATNGKLELETSARNFMDKNKN